MEQVTTVQAAPQTSLRQMLGMGQAGGQVQGDAFAMIFQQLHQELPAHGVPLINHL